MADQPQVNFRMDVADDLRGGVYANFLSIWHTSHEFTLDFASTELIENHEEGVVVPARVTARVKIPPTLVFDLLRVLNENMTRYEKTYGEIHRPGERGTPE